MDIIKWFNDKKNAKKDSDFALGYAFVAMRMLHDKIGDPGYHLENILNKSSDYNLGMRQAYVDILDTRQSIIAQTVQKCNSQ